MNRKWLSHNICSLLFVVLLAACASGDFPTPTPPNNLSIPPGYAGNPVFRNADWNPVVQVFDTVEMVLVPAGCFNMGAFGREADEAPMSTQCFDNPFWLDRYEVSNAQFAAFSGVAAGEPGWPEPGHPRTRISWVEARIYCERRGGRLPTEAEWEYAARGPNGLFYPWGNDWQPDYLVWPGNANGQPSQIGSRPNGASWVAAQDMAGNVWEWVSTLYDGFSYPYAADGRENPEDSVLQRVMRGSSYYDASDYYAQSSNRARAAAYLAGVAVGFRCARAY